MLETAAHHWRMWAEIYETAHNEKDSKRCRKNQAKYLKKLERLGVEFAKGKEP